MEKADEQEQQILAKEKEALRSFMKRRAAKRCQQEQAQYAACIERVGMFVWRCRPEAKAMNNCFAQYTSNAELTRLESRWLNDGKPSLQHWHPVDD